jgi:cell division protein YceG involved in septum cleavage
LYPATVPFLYFVAAPDGHHEFRKTLAEHEVAVRQMRR